MLSNIYLIIVSATGKLFMCGDGKYGKLCIDDNQITTPTLVLVFVDKGLKVQMVNYSLLVTVNISISKYFKYPRLDCSVFNYL